MGVSRSSGSSLATRADNSSVTLVRIVNEPKVPASNHIRIVKQKIIKNACRTSCKLFSRSLPWSSSRLRYFARVFARLDQLKVTERLTMSIGLSVTMVVAIGLLFGLFSSAEKSYRRNHCVFVICCARFRNNLFAD